MTPLRKKMILAMRQRGFSPRTHQSYLAAVTDLARFFHKSPDKIEACELQKYFDYLVQDRNLSPASCRLYLNGVRFLYLKVLEWPSFDVELVVPRRSQRIPELLTRANVKSIIAACHNPKHKMLLELTYGCGLRVSEVVKLRVRDIDGERGLLRVVQAKGAKDRMVTLPATLLQRLRGYWTLCRPQEWLFPSSRAAGGSICLTTAQRIFTHAKRRAGIEKIGGIHSLRHAYATHQLESGLPVHELQRLLGHRNLQSTERYLHWLPGCCDAKRGHTDLLANIGAQQ
jgi:integrase/recombinase XerD